MTRAVLFDAAGTLVELVEPVGATYARVAAEHGVSLPAWRLGDAFARIVRRMPPMCFPDVAVGEIPARERAWWRDLVRQVVRATDGTAQFADFEAFFAGLWEHYAGARGWRLRAGAPEALATLAARGLALGVASNFDHRLPKILDELGIAPFFGVVALPSTARAAKPDPGLLEAALDALGVEAADAAVVGDDDARDGAAARACGARFIDVSGWPSLAALPSLLEASYPRSPDDRPHRGDPPR